MSKIAVEEARRRKAVGNLLVQFKTVVQSYAIGFHTRGNKMGVSRAAFMLQMIGDLEEQIPELIKEIDNG